MRALRETEERAAPGPGGRRTAHSDGGVWAGFNKEHANARAGDRGTVRASTAPGAGDGGHLTPQAWEVSLVTQHGGPPGRAGTLGPARHGLEGREPVNEHRACLPTRGPRGFPAAPTSPKSEGKEPTDAAHADRLPGSGGAGRCRAARELRMNEDWLCL